MEKEKYSKAAIIVLVILIIWSLFPVYWTWNTSLKSQKEIYSMAPTLIPMKASLDSYRKLIFGENFLKSVWNSVVVAVAVTAVSIAVSVFAAYAFARVKFKGRGAWNTSILYAYLMPRSIVATLPVLLMYTAMSKSRIPRCCKGIMRKAGMRFRRSIGAAITGKGWRL